MHNVLAWRHDAGFVAITLTRTNQIFARAIIDWLKTRVELAST